jgi:hypothetical protein
MLFFRLVLQLLQVEAGNLRASACLRGLPATGELRATNKLSHGIHLCAVHYLPGSEHVRSVRRRTNRDAARDQLRAATGDGAVYYVSAGGYPIELCDASLHDVRCGVFIAVLQRRRVSSSGGGRTDQRLRYLRRRCQRELCPAGSSLCRASDGHGAHDDGCADVQHTTVRSAVVCSSASIRRSALVFGSAVDGWSCDGIARNVGSHAGFADPSPVQWHNAEHISTQQRNAAEQFFVNADSADTGHQFRQRSAIAGSAEPNDIGPDHWSGQRDACDFQYRGSCVCVPCSGISSGEKQTNPECQRWLVGWFDQQ